MYSQSIVTLVLGLVLLGAVAASDIPVEKNELFFIARSKDDNTIRYVLNTDRNGELDPESPIRVYWIKYGKICQNPPLTYIQRKYAYGLKFFDVTDDKARFQFVSYDKRDFWLQKSDSLYKVFTVSEGKTIEVENIFLQIDGGTFWLPKITKAVLNGRDPVAGTPVEEVVVPGM